MFKRTPRNQFTLAYLFGPSGLLVVFTTITLILLCAQMLIANQLATDGEKVSKNELLTADLNQQSDDLRNQINSLGSFERINQKATALGFVSVTKVSVLTQTPYAFAR